MTVTVILTLDVTPEMTTEGTMTEVMKGVTDIPLGTIQEGTTEVTTAEATTDTHHERRQYVNASSQIDILAYGQNT